MNHDAPDSKDPAPGSDAAEQHYGDLRKGRLPETPRGLPAAGQWWQPAGRHAGSAGTKRQMLRKSG